MTLEEQLRDIFSRPVNEWTEAENHIILKGNAEYGRARVKELMEEVTGVKQ